MKNDTCENIQSSASEEKRVVAEKIKALREAKNITQAELARILCVTRAGVNSWEQGLSTPSPASLVDIARYFGVSTDYLLGGGSYAAICVDGLNEADVAILAELANRLRRK